MSDRTNSQNAFMIEYITRFKVKYQKEITNMEQAPLKPPFYQTMQLGRARRVVEAANIILSLGPNAMNENREEFEKQRTIVFSNNLAFRITERQIRESTAQCSQLLNHLQMQKMRMIHHR